MSAQLLSAFYLYNFLRWYNYIIKLKGDRDMDHIFIIESGDRNQGNILKKSIEIKLTEEQYRTVQAIAI